MIKWLFSRKGSAQDTSEKASLPEAPSVAFDRPLLYLSYHRNDRHWAERIKSLLSVYVKKRQFHLWEQSLIKPGSVWRNEIKSAVARASVALVLVSENFLGSDEEHVTLEFNEIVQSGQQGNSRLVWVPLGLSLYAETPLSHYQALLPPEKPLDRLPVEQVDVALIELAKRVAAMFPSPE